MVCVWQGAVEWQGSCVQRCACGANVDLCRESGVAEEWKRQGFVSFGDGAVSKVENAAKF